MSQVYIRYALLAPLIHMGAFTRPIFQDPDCKGPNTAEDTVIIPKAWLTVASHLEQELEDNLT